MAKAEAIKSDTARLKAATRAVFLAALSETANVSASAKAAGISGSAVYAERRRLPAFRGEWELALAEGYARLEADLLAEALQTASGKTSEGTLKARAQKHRLGIALLSAHRLAVKGAPATRPVQEKSDLGVLKAQLILKLTHMRERAGITLDGGAVANTQTEAREHVDAGD